jgi:hypothetical protein
MYIWAHSNYMCHLFSSPFFQYVIYYILGEIEYFGFYISFFYSVKTLVKLYAFLFLVVF